MYKIEPRFKMVVNNFMRKDNLKLRLHYQSLIKVLLRKHGQSFLGQVQLFTLSKLSEELVQEITENVLKSSKNWNISH